PHRSLVFPYTTLFRSHFVEYTGAVTSLFPSSLTVSFAWAATVAETLFGILLIAGFKIRMASVLSALLLLSFEACDEQYPKEGLRDRKSTRLNSSHVSI